VNTNLGRQAQLQPVVTSDTQKWRGRLTNRLVQAAVHILVILLSFSFALPFVWMLSTSLKTDPQVYTVPPTFIPDPARWLNYPEALTYVPFGKYLLNTLKYGVFASIGAVMSSALCAYGFSKVRWRGRDALFFIVLITMMLPFQVRMIPLYLIFNKLGWVGTYLPLIIPSYTGVAYFIFLLRQFFMTIPMDLSDAARIDGAGELGIFFRIIMPLAKPALAVVALFEFMNDWNDYIGPLVYIGNDTDKYPIAMGLEQMRAHLNQAHVELMWPRLMAASAVMILPVVLIFFFTQRTFVEGIALTGVKG
jgi:multiple sugar transport system permease protein